jgi:hypothetical protein
VDGRENYLIEKRKENLRHFRNGLVAEATEDEDSRAVFAEQSGKPRAKCPGSGWIVRDVENPFDAA